MSLDSKGRKRGRKYLEGERTACDTPSRFDVQATAGPLGWGCCRGSAVAMSRSYKSRRCGEDQAWPVGAVNGPQPVADTGYRGLASVTWGYKGVVAVLKNGQSSTALSPQGWAPAWLWVCNDHPQWEKHIPIRDRLLTTFPSWLLAVPVTLAAQGAFTSGTQR
jgi:hypothetical protein